MRWLAPLFARWRLCTLHGLFRSTGNEVVRQCAVIPLGPIYAPMYCLVAPVQMAKGHSKALMMLVGAPFLVLRNCIGDRTTHFCLDSHSGHVNGLIDRVSSNAGGRLPFLQRAKVALWVLAIFFSAMLPLAPARANALDLHPGQYYAASPSQNSQTVGQKATQRAKDLGAWYIVRASGLVGAALLVLLMLSGMGLVTGFTYRFLEPLTAWAVHRAMGIALLWSIAVHMGVLLIDKIHQFRVVDLFVPFMTNGKPYPDTSNWGLGMGLGVMATYAAMAVVATSILWINTRVRRWRLIHFISYGLAVAVFIHGLFVGTDLSKGYARILWVAFGVVIVVGIVARLFRAGTISGGKR